MVPERCKLKQAMSLAVVLVVVASVLSIAPTGVAAQESTAETEPNNASVGGTPVTTEEVTGTISPAGTDYDWFVIRAEQGETIEATGNFEIPSDVSEFEMTILAPNGSELASQQQAGSQVGVAAVAPETGRYYVGIQSTTTNTEIGLSGSIPYTLTVTPTLDTIPASYTGSPDLAEQPQSESEPNNARVGGGEIQNAPVNGSLEPKGDDDWFKIEAETGQRIEATVTYQNVGNDTNTRLQLVGPGGTDITTVDEYGFPRLSAGVIAQQSGTYYVHLSANREIGAMPYSLTAFAAGGEGNATDNATRSTNTSSGETTSESTPSDSSANGSTSNVSVEYPPGYGASGVTDPVRAANQHRSALSSSSSYTSMRNFTSVFQNETNYENSTLRINTTTKRAYTYENLSGGGTDPIVTEAYYANGTAYQRTNSSFSSSPEYETGVFPFESFANRSIPFAERYLKNADYGSATPVERNGETVFRYEASEITGRPIIWYVPSENTDNVTSFNSTILVDQSGVVQSLSFSVTLRGDDGNLVRKQVDRQITGLNTTSIGTPSWLDQAKTNASTSPQTTVSTPNQETETLAPSGDAPTTTVTVTDTETPTVTPTPSATEAATATTTTTNGSVSTETTTGTSSSSPGFGIVIAVVTVIMATLLSVCRE
jgi:hypothetical protein